MGWATFVCPVGAGEGECVGFLKLCDEVRDIKMIPGSFQLTCFDHEAEFLELGEITQGGTVSDACHFLILSVVHSSINPLSQFVVDEAIEHFELS